MPDPEQQLFEANDDDDVYKNEDNFVYQECVNLEEKDEEDEDKEEKPEIYYNALKIFNQLTDREFQPAESVVKTEDQDESPIDMFGDEFHLHMKKKFCAAKKADETNEAVRIKEEHVTDFDATEIDDEDYAAVSESQQNTELVVRQLVSASGEQQLLNNSSSRQRGVKSYQCQQCSKSFENVYSFKRHKLVHSDIRPFKCTTCFESFKYKYVLKRHQLVHSDDRPFQCTACLESFKTATALKLHQLVLTDTHRNHQCTTCSKLFKCKRSLQEHQMKHIKMQTFKCKTCSESFKRKQDFQRHQLVHSSIRAFKCTICFNSFKSNNELKRHQFVHSDSRPFQCSICQESFKWKQSFNRHHQAKH